MGDPYVAAPRCPAQDRPPHLSCQRPTPEPVSGQQLPDQLACFPGPGAPHRGTNTLSSQSHFPEETDLANKNIGCPVNFEFQVNNE